MIDSISDGNGSVIPLRMVRHEQRFDGILSEHFADSFCSCLQGSIDTSLVSCNCCQFSIFEFSSIRKDNTFRFKAGCIELRLHGCNIIAATQGYSSTRPFGATTQHNTIEHKTS